ncbi:MAG: cell division protein FtsA [Hyphomicrobiaceae bacterium]|nr:cell division protein FtsA [Hyphomicrobiaceae bacterium]
MTVLDVGSSKVCCIIARLKPRDGAEVLRGRSHTIEVIGFGHYRARGVKSGVVTDLDEAERSIRHAVDQAERMAGLTVDSLIVTVSAGRLASETYSASVALDGHAVENSDIARVLAAGKDHALADGRLTVHALPIGYAIDAEHGIQDPRGMIGDMLGVDMHVVTADGSPLRNLERCLNRCHLEVEAMVAAPYASGLSALVSDEAQLGTVLVDMGAGTTTIGAFIDGEFVHVDAIALGGQHVTMDLARGLSMRLEDAERFKTLHGSALPGPSDDRDVITVPPVSDHDGDAPNHIPRSALTKVIRPRAEEILELVRDRLASGGLTGMAQKRLVLTGGASQLSGLSELSRRIVSRNVRLGRPLGVSGLPEAARGAAFSAAVGLLIYPQMLRVEPVSVRRPRISGRLAGGYFARMGQWLRESL